MGDQGNAGAPSEDVTDAQQHAAEAYISNIVRGLLRGAKSAVAHGKFHRNWQNCGMCHAVKLGMAFVAAMDLPDPDGGGEPVAVEPVSELPEYEDRRAVG